MAEPDFNPDTLMRGYQSSLITLALNHNAAVVEYAASLISAGELKRSSHKRAIEQFKRIHKDYYTQYKKIIDQAEAEFSNEAL